MKSVILPTDLELLELAKAGSESAFRQLVLRYEGAVIRTITAMLGEVMEVEDVAQEVFIRFYRSLGKFRGEAGLKTYLTRMAINQSLTELKRRKQWYQGFARPAAENTLPEWSDNQSAETSQDAKGLVEWGLQQLEPDFRVVIVLRLIEGYSVKETAQLLQLPEGTVASRLARGQQKLLDILKENQ